MTRPEPHLSDPFRREPPWRPWQVLVWYGLLAAVAAGLVIRGVL